LAEVDPGAAIDLGERTVRNASAVVAVTRP
jgi:hypothetical protein